MSKAHKDIIVAIDGPAGSGKSTVSKILAKRLGLIYVDTGAMYRALTLKAMREGIDLEDEAALAAMARATRIDLREEDGRLKVIMDDEDVGPLIRTPELTNNVKYIARVAAVRKEMVRLQRAIGRRSGAVLEGRDIGTVVFPDADYKFYLDAAEDERVKRRYKELLALGQEVSLEDMQRDVSSRDKSDMKRSVGALKKADDAVCIDTTSLSIEGVVDRIFNLIDR